MARRRGVDQLLTPRTPTPAAGHATGEDQEDRPAIRPGRLLARFQSSPFSGYAVPDLPFELVAVFREIHGHEISQAEVDMVVRLILFCGRELPQRRPEDLFAENLGDVLEEIRLDARGLRPGAGGAPVAAPGARKNPGAPAVDSWFDGSDLGDTD